MLHPACCCCCCALRCCLLLQPAVAVAATNTSSSLQLSRTFLLQRSFLGCIAVNYHEEQRRHLHWSHIVAERTLPSRRCCRRCCDGASVCCTPQWTAEAAAAARAASAEGWSKATASSIQWRAAPAGNCARAFVSEHKAHTCAHAQSSQRVSAAAATEERIGRGLKRLCAGSFQSDRQRWRGR